ncbi:hypothetical protein GCM10023205_63180 [Yinghuangia aomiensis]|uniref:Transcriptional regulator, TetR family n=1 Tax=Yinghuangia aomiensis TaxID=676205 RepID=A0ABP9I0R1_9ACTN
MTADSRVAPGTPTRTRQPRADAADTREALLSSGARLIARHGLGVPVTQIQDAAAQRNKSAVRYHFGSVLELALAVTTRHGQQVDARRDEALDAFHERYAPPGTDDGRPHAELAVIVDLLVSPAAEELHTAQGRDYLRLLPQVSHLAQVRSGAPAAPPAVVRTLALLRDHLDRSGVSDIDERLALAVQMHAAVMADRARRIDEGADGEPAAEVRGGEREIAPDHDGFVRLVTGMLARALGGAG